MGLNVVDPASDPGSLRMRRREHEGLPQAFHPVLMKQAKSADEALFVTEQQTELIQGMPREESDALLRLLFAHLYDDSHVYVHEWQPGDLIVWDNRAIQHARPELSAIPRTLRRVSVGGSSVFEFFRNSDGPMHRPAGD